MKKSILGNGLKTAMNNSINVPKTDEINIGGDFINTGSGIKSASQEYVEKDLLNATTPDQAKQVVQTGEILKSTINDAENIIKNQGIIDATAYNPNREPQITRNDIDMGIFSTTKGMTPEQIQAMQGQFSKSVRDKRLNAVEPAIEALGLQDYFPSIGHNIKVGGYSGKVLGNVDIFVAGGGQIPFALRDARKRAMEKDAQAKAMQADKIKQLNFDTVPQYQSQYSDLAMKFIDDNLKLANYDANELYNGKTELSRKFKEGIVKFENLDKEVTYVDEVAKKVFTDLKSGKYVSPEAVELLTQWQEGKLNLEEFISEGGKFPSLVEKMKSYSNVDEYTNKMADQMKETGMTIRPLDNNKMSTDSAHLTKALDAFKLKKGSGYDSYISSVGKYYDTEKVTNYIDATWEDSDFYKGNSKQEEDIQKAKFAETLFAKLGSEITVDMKNQANDDLERARLAFDKKKYEDQTEQFFEHVNDVTLNAGNTIQNRINQLETARGGELTPQEKRNIIKDEYAKAGLTPEETDRGFATFKVSKTTTKTGTTQPFNMSTRPEEFIVNITTNDGRKLAVPMSKLGNYQGAKFTKTGKKLSSQDYSDASYLTGSGAFNMNVTNQFGYFADIEENGNAVPYERSKGKGKKTTIIGSEGSVIVPVLEVVKGEYDSEGKPVMEQKYDSEGKPVMRTSNITGSMYIDNSEKTGQSILGAGRSTETGQINKIGD